MLWRQPLQLLLFLALFAQTHANFTAIARQPQQPLRVAFAPHPFLSHWAVSAPIAQELLERGHKALVRAHSMLGFGAQCCTIMQHISIIVHRQVFCVHQHVLMVALDT